MSEHIITAKRVPEAQRMGFLPTTFGKPGAHWAWHGEGAVFNKLRKLCRQYTGGTWHFYRLSNEGFYMAPEMEDQLRLANMDNGYVGEMSADAAGIVVTLFVLNGFAWNTHVTDPDASEYFAAAYYLLRDFARQHAEAGEILKVID